jgi:hypothetical protein
MSADSFTPIFYQAVKHHLSHVPIQFYTQANLEKVIEADALTDNVFWVSGKVLLRFDEVTETMKSMIANSHEDHGTVQ